MPSELRITSSLLAQIAAGCEAAYPDEGCGVLVGSINADRHLIKRVISLRNAGQTQADWFEIDSADLLAVERSARTDGLTVVGFYHSHPNSPCKPSRRDLERAWPMYTNLIVTVTANRMTDYAAWTLLPDASGFESQDINVLEEEE